MTTDRTNARFRSGLAILAGVATLVALTPGCGGGSSGGKSTAVVATSPSIQIVSGGNQSAIVGTALPGALTVLVKDASGKPLSGATVAFAVTAGSGTLSAASAATGAAGTASVTLTLGKIAGTNTVVASLSGATGSPLTFTETGVFGGATKIVATNSNVGVNVNGTGTLTALVTDASGNPVPGVIVTFSVPSSGGTLSATSATTDATGDATVTVTGTALGSFTVTATANGIGTPTTFTVNVSPPSGAPVISGISVVANSSMVLPPVAPPVVVGTTAIQYTVATSSGTPTNVSVKIDAGDGLGFRNATEASNPAGTPFQTFNIDGTTNLTTSSAGTKHVFLWDSLADARTASTDSAQIQITGTFSGSVGAPVMISNVKIRNGVTFGAVTTDPLTPVGTTIPAGSQVVAMADIDLDGKLDLITIDATASTAQIYNGDGAGNFTASVVTAPIAVGPAPGAVIVADVDRNGLPDIIVYSATNSDVTVLLQGPLGTFTLSSYNPGLTTTASQLSLAVADIANTGSLDIVCASSAASAYTVLQQTSPGVFLTTHNVAGGTYPFPLGAQPTGIAVADVNQDGKVDVLFTTAGGVALVVSGTTPTVQTFAAGTNPSAIALADLNGDGQLDAVVTNKGSKNVSVLFGSGFTATKATFAPAVNFAVGTSPVGVSLVDIDSDGKIDIVVANSSGSPNVTVLQNQTTFRGTTPKFVALATPIPATGVTPVGIVTADFNRDGSTDIVTLNSTVPNFTFIPGASSPHTPSFPSTTFTLAGQVGPGSTSTNLVFSKIVVADINGDGLPDIIAADDRQFSQSGTGIVNIFLGAGNGTYTLTSVFDPSAATPNGLGPSIFMRGLLVADFDGDGKLDICVANAAIPEGFNIYLGNGDGTFATTAQPIALTGESPQQLVVADVNGDGKPDIVYLDLLSPTTAARVQINQSTAGTKATPAVIKFAESGPFQLGNGPYSLKAGDLNGDGLADFVVVNQGDQTVSVFLNNGTKNGTTASFVKTDFPVGRVPTDAAILDVNGDGKMDVLVANGGDNDLTLLAGDGAGNFAAPVNFGTGSNPTFIAVGDLNADGKNDVVVCNAQSTFLSVSLAGGSAGLVAKPNIPLGANVGTLALITDLNGDGNKDVAFVPQIPATPFGPAIGTNLITVIEGDSTADFTPKGALLSTAGLNGLTNSPLSVAVGDLNGDGLLDLVTADRDDGSVAIFLALPKGGYAPALKVSPLSASTSPIQVAIADVNQDGKPDLVILSSNFNGGSPDALVVCLQTPVAGVPTFPSAGQASYLTGTITSFGSAVAMAVADLNGDGIPDVGIVNGFEGTFSVFLGSPTGTYASMTDSNGQPGPFLLANTSGGYGIAVADMNHDGSPDLVIANGDASISVLAGPDLVVDLALTSAPNTGLSSGFLATPIVIADFNQDGNLDIAVASTDTSGSANIYIFLGDGIGNFTASASSPITDPNVVCPVSMIACDLNGDGLLDLVVCNNASVNSSPGSDNAVVLMQSASLNFAASLTPPFLTTGAGPQGLATGDLNHDGLLDVVITNQTDGTVQIFRQK